MSQFVARCTSRTAAGAVTCATLFAGVVACSDSTAPAAPVGPSGIVVLNGYGQTGLTLVPDSGSQTSHIDFGTSFDGAAVTVAGSTAASTSSKSGGDLLYLADLSAGTLRTIQLPAASNPAGVASLGGANWAVALRDSGSIALVDASSATSATITQLYDAGRCPVDVAAQGGSYWVLDANKLCASTYDIQGPARLIRVPATGTARDTIPLGTTALDGNSVVVIGNDAYVSTAGEATYYPTTTFVAPGAIVKVDLQTRQVVGTLSFPIGTYGAGMKLGADGQLYVVVYTGTDFTQSLFVVSPSTMSFVGPFATGSSARRLTLTDGSSPSCSAAIGDALHRIYCVSNDAVSAGATTLYVFDQNGTQLRAVSAGVYGFDVALR